MNGFCDRPIYDRNVLQLEDTVW